MQSFAFENSVRAVLTCLFLLFSCIVAQDIPEFNNRSAFNGGVFVMYHASGTVTFFFLKKDLPFALCSPRLQSLCLMFCSTGWKRKNAKGAMIRGQEE